MPKCLGIYIENNLIKYAKVSKERNDFSIESFGIRFFDDLHKEIKRIIEETYSFNIPVSINLTNEKYMYYDIFALLTKGDMQKSVETEFETYCEEKKYNPKAFETRYALVPNVENADKVKAIQVAVNKIELNKQKQYLEKGNLARITPIGTAIASIGKFDKKENALIINMEDKTTITTIYNSQIYNVETIDAGSEEILEKINRTENSMSKAYEICKSTTIYTANVIEDTKEQPYMEDIIPKLYEICEKMKKIVETSPVKIDTVYLTGTLSVINNVDLYFQEFLADADCRILKPNILEATSSRVNIKDYIEVNSAIALAMTELGEGVQSLNFKQNSVLDKLSTITKVDFGGGGSGGGSFHKVLDTTEKVLLRCAMLIVLLDVIFAVFSKMLYTQMENKKDEVQTLINQENAEISKINSNIQTLTSYNNKYNENTTKIKTLNDRISNITEMKDLIPNLLNQLMWAIPEQVQLTSIKNTSDRHIEIQAKSLDYDQLGYFLTKIKIEGFLTNVISSSSQKSGGYVTVTIEGELP